ncbi:hypothetical protein EDC01DRAFT_648544 [Geopyxis carbonaria]|nr:hypothetical protein EDC01DRAFT_648544 [Geopyxis carbonaria]
MGAGMVLKSPKGRGSGYILLLYCYIKLNFSGRLGTVRRLLYLYFLYSFPLDFSLLFLVYT